MNAVPPRFTLDTLGEQLAAGPGTLADAIRVCGGRPVQVDTVTQVSLGSPFALARLDESRGKVNIYLDLAPGDWLLQDLVTDASGWAEIPRLPTSGALMVLRRWLVPKKMEVRCSVRIGGQGPLAKRPVLGTPQCTVWPF